MVDRAARSGGQSLYCAPSEAEAYKNDCRSRYEIARHIQPAQDYLN